MLDTFIYNVFIDLSYNQQEIKFSHFVTLLKMRDLP